MSDQVFTFEDTKPEIADADLLTDIRAVAAELGVESLPANAYRKRGRYSATAVKRRFGTWNAAIRAAGLLSSGVRRDLPEAELFENLRDVWVALGRQPRKREMIKPTSRFTHHPYVERYGGWLDAVKVFLASAEREESEMSALPSTKPSRGPRDPSWRLRFLVMRRDGFRCRQCVASPATTAGVELHVDHILAWLGGGTTTIDNLQTLCVRCNLGKSDLKASEGGQ